MARNKIARHHIFNAHSAQIRAIIHLAHQIALSDNTEQISCPILHDKRTHAILNQRSQHHIQCVIRSNRNHAATFLVENISNGHDHTSMSSGKNFMGSKKIKSGLDQK